MKKNYLIYLIIFSLGIILGAVFNNVWQESNIPILNKVPKEPTKIIRVTDTVFVKHKSKPIEKPELVEADVVDTLISVIDSVKVQEPAMDSVDVEIIRERMVAKVQLSVQLIEQDSIAPGDVFNNVTEPFQKKITVEYWESPLNLTGYQLSKSRLKLFGFNPKEKIQLIEGQNAVLILQMSESQVTLQKTEQFKSL